MIHGDDSENHQLALLFQGHISTTFRCRNMHEQPYLIRNKSSSQSSSGTSSERPGVLPLPVATVAKKPLHKIDDCLSNFLIWENTDNDTRFQCDCCSDTSPPEKNLEKLPNVLVVQLKRYIYIYTMRTSNGHAN